MEQRSKPRRHCDMALDDGLYLVEPWLTSKDEEIPPHVATSRKGVQWVYDTVARSYTAVDCTVSWTLP